MKEEQKTTQTASTFENQEASLRNLPILDISVLKLQFFPFGMYIYNIRQRRQVGVVVLSSSFTSGGPGSSPALSTGALGFQSLPDPMGFTHNITSAVFLPPLKLCLLLIIIPYRFLQAYKLQCLGIFE